MTGIEPAFSAWEADVLPLNYIGNVGLNCGTLSACLAPTLSVTDCHNSIQTRSRLLQCSRLGVSIQADRQAGVLVRVPRREHRDRSLHWEHEELDTAVDRVIGAAEVALFKCQPVLY